MTATNPVAPMTDARPGSEITAAETLRTTRATPIADRNQPPRSDSSTSTALRAGDRAVCTAAAADLIAVTVMASQFPEGRPIWR